MYKITEGYLPFLSGRTYYRIVEPQQGADPTKAPIILLHGGPGSTHNYFEVLDCFADDGRAVISYDQIGCGKSYLDGQPQLWTLDTWMRELKALIQHLGLTKFHLLGQSWGGMLELAYLIDEGAQGVCSAVLSSTLSSSQLWGREQHRMIRYLPEEEQQAIAEAEASGNYQDERYLQANDHYMELHCMGKVSADAPECLRRKKVTGDEAYRTAWGPNEYTPLGTLRNFDYTDRLGWIHVPCLIISGTDDLCTPLVAKTMYDRIPDAHWELFEGCRHMCFVDDHAKYCTVVEKWLREND